MTGGPEAHKPPLLGLSPHTGKLFLNPLRDGAAQRKAKAVSGDEHLGSQSSSAKAPADSHIVDETIQDDLEARLKERGFTFDGASDVIPMIPKRPRPDSEQGSAAETTET